MPKLGCLTPPSASSLGACLPMWTMPNQKCPSPTPLGRLWGSSQLTGLEVPPQQQKFPHQAASSSSPCLCSWHCASDPRQAHCPQCPHTQNCCYFRLLLALFGSSAGCHIFSLIELNNYGFIFIFFPFIFFLAFFFHGGL